MLDVLIFDLLFSFVALGGIHNPDVLQSGVVCPFAPPHQCSMLLLCYCPLHIVDQQIPIPFQSLCGLTNQCFDKIFPLIFVVVVVVARNCWIWPNP